MHCHWELSSKKNTSDFAWSLCDISRWRVSHVECYLESKVSTFRHRGARLRSVGWASQHGGVDWGRVWRCPQWEESSMQKKWSHTWSSDIRRSVWQVSESLTANWSATYRQLCHPKWRLDFYCTTMLQSAVVAVVILSLCHTHASSSSVTCLWGSCLHSDHTTLMTSVEMTVMYYQTFASQVTRSDSRVWPRHSLQMLARFQIF